MTPLAETEARKAGYQASQTGAPISANPYANTSIVLYQAWRRGYQQGEVDEAEGAHFRTPTRQDG